MTASKQKNISQIYDARQDALVNEICGLLVKRFNKDIHQALLLFLVTAFLTWMPTSAESQLLNSSHENLETINDATSHTLNPAYIRPTERIKASNYVFNMAGPYPIVGAAFAAGINQISNSPPEWKQGVEGYARRFGSNFGIEAVGTTARYGLSEVFNDDTMFYRCECSGVLPRISHAVLSTLTARRGEDGHRVFSLPALIAPYAGSMTAIYGWYPDRFGAKDAFRLGNYSLLVDVGGNVALEFLYGGPHSLLSKMHLGRAHSSSSEGSNQ